jgi:aspartate aminotransferase
MRISQRTANITASATLAVSAKAKRMKAQGVDVVSFGAGEPDFDTPDFIKEAAKEGLDKGMTKYAPASGTLDLKKAVAEKLRQQNGLNYEPSQVVISCGGKHALYGAFQVLVEEGDEVLLPSPYWVSYPEQIKLAGGKVVELRGEEKNDFKLKSEQIVEAINERTKVLVLNSPSNPGGFTYTPKELKGIAEAVVDKDIITFSDEIYENLVYGDQKFVSFATLADGLMEKTVTFNGLAKTYSMTGWRIGYAAGPQEIISAMGRLQSHETSNPVTFCMYAAIAALKGDQDCVRQMRDEFAKRAEHMWQRLNAIKGISCIKPTGAFYCFANVSACYDKLGVNGSAAFADAVLDKANVALVPGVAFGWDTHVRLCFAASMEQIDKGLDRLAELLA